MIITNKFIINGTILNMNEHDNNVVMKVDKFPGIIFMDSRMTGEFSCGDRVSISGFAENHSAHNKQGYVTALIGTNIRYYSARNKCERHMKSGLYLATGVVKEIFVDQSFHVFVLIDTSRKTDSLFCTVECHGKQAKYALRNLSIGSRIAVSGAIEAHHNNAYITCMDLVSMDEIKSQKQAG